MRGRFPPKRYGFALTLELSFLRFGSQQRELVIPFGRSHIVGRELLPGALEILPQKNTRGDYSNVRVLPPLRRNCLMSKPEPRVINFTLPFSSHK